MKKKEKVSKAIIKTIALGTAFSLSAGALTGCSEGKSGDDTNTDTDNKVVDGI